MSPVLSASGVPPTSDSTLINGLGRYSGDTTADLAVISVVAGKRYRFRLISLSCDPNYVFSIDNHTMVSQTALQLWTAITSLYSSLSSRLTATMSPPSQPTPSKSTPANVTLLSSPPTRQPQTTGSARLPTSADQTASRMALTRRFCATRPRMQLSPTHRT